MTITKNFPIIFFEGLKTTMETSVSTTDIPAVIRTEYLPDASPVANKLKCSYKLRKLPGSAPLIVKLVRRVQMKTVS